MNSLFVTMLMNIENKYGKDSKEATTIKLYIISFENKKKYNINDVIAKYRELMKRKNKKGWQAETRPRDASRRRPADNWYKCHKFSIANLL